MAEAPQETPEERVTALLMADDSSDNGFTICQVCMANVFADAQDHHPELDLPTIVSHPDLDLSTNVGFTFNQAYASVKKTWIL